MGNKGNDISGKFQTGLHSFGHNEYNKAKRFLEPDGSIVYDSPRVHNSKMGEIGKIVFNVAGISSFIMGVLTNWNNFISALLGIVGLLYACIKCAKEIEDYRFRRAERKKIEHEVDKYIKNTDSSL